MRVKVTARTRPFRTARARRQAARRVLVAAGVAPAPLLANYDLTRGTPSMRFFLEQAFSAGIENYSADGWPCDSPTLDTTTAVFRDGASAIFEDSGTLALVELAYGWMHVHVAADAPGKVGPVFAAFRQAYPASYLTQSADPRVPITFWANSNMGPTARLRKVDSALWEDISGNYASAVEEHLASLMGWRDGPPNKDGGQLILWQGPPGTGKSWALRALASEWAPWAEFHYITDPDSFFVDDPSYMIQVLLADSYEAIDEPTGDVYSEQRDGKWRILILEDTGELLSATAKEKYGQGLSRLLNVVDGMIGQGLKVLALVTTNDELGDLHPAVTRPGRCAMQIEFGPLSDEEARTWTGNPDATSGTLAELYAQRGAVQDAFADDDPEDGWAENELRAAIYATAHEWRGEMVGYGETAWLEDERAVLYVSGDWTDTDPIDEAFLAIDGVKTVSHEAEGLPDGWWDAEVIYPDDPPLWVLEPPDEAALADILTLARAPLDIADDPTPLTAAAPRDEAFALAERALDVMEAFARKEAVPAPAPTFNIHLPATSVGLTVERQTPDVTVPVTVETGETNIHVPEFPPAQVTVAAADPAPIIVQLPEQDPAPVHVHVPEAAVTVNVEQPRPRTVRVEEDDDGTRRYISEEADAA